MTRDPLQDRVVSSRDLADAAPSPAFCLWCKNPVYDARRYRGDRALRQEATRGRITFATMMHVVTGLDGERDVCGTCVRRLGDVGGCAPGHRAHVVVQEG